LYWLAPNGTRGKAETAAPGRHEAPICKAIVWFHSVGIRDIRPQLGLAIPGIGHPLANHRAGWIVELVKPGRGTRLEVRLTPDTTSTD
jgi:hypothetical protein